MKNVLLKNLFSNDSYHHIKMNKIGGRYITNSSLELVIEKFRNDFEIDILGKSVLQKPIYRFKIGSGKIRILVWSQMHGNEATTTKAIFDFLNSCVLNSDDLQFSSILENCSIRVIPILNPDGAEAYTRVNANEIDLNRDLQDLSQPESKLLKKEFDSFQPNFCLNLHDQRTIFSAGKYPKSAILSFLTPSKDKERTIDIHRELSMSIIAGMAHDLYDYLPDSIGRYDDGFNINCAGDTFQSLDVPTILFEAGHSPGDYEREETRKQVYRALLSCFYQIATDVSTSRYRDYFNIPENEKLFNDLIIRNATINDEFMDISFQFKEVLKNSKIHFQPVVEKIAPKILNFGHKEIDAEGKTIKLPDNSEFTENVVVNKIILNNEELEVLNG